MRQYDFFRTYKGKVDLLTGHQTEVERARPVQTLIWYPAVRGGTPISYGGHTQLATNEVAFDAPNGSMTAESWIGKRWFGLSPAKLKQEVNRPMQAVRDAVPTSGKFPCDHLRIQPHQHRCYRAGEAGKCLRSPVPAQEIALWALYPSRRLLNARVSAFLDMLRQAFPKAAPEELATYLAG